MFAQVRRVERTYCAPNSLMLRLANQCPMWMDSSIDFPSTTPASSPAAKASLEACQLIYFFKIVLVTCS